MNKNIPLDHVKDPSLSVGAPKNESAGEAADERDRAVQRRMNEFWFALHGVTPNFNIPNRYNSGQGKAPLPPNNPDVQLDATVQAVLEELTYQEIEADRWTEEEPAKIRNAPAPALAAPQPQPAPQPPQPSDGPDRPAEPAAEPDRGRSFVATQPLPAQPGPAAPLWPLPRQESPPPTISFPMGRTPAPKVPDYSDEELGLSRSPLSYSFDDGIAVLSRVLRTHSKDLGRLAAIMTRHFGPMMHQHGEVGSSTSREQVVDAAVAVLIPMARDPGLDGVVIQLVPALRRVLGAGLVAELEGRSFSTLGPGEIATLSSLASLAFSSIAGMSRAVEYEPWVVIYNHEVLRMIASMPRDSLAAPGSSFDRLLKASANNVAAGIGRIVQRNPPQSLNHEVWRRLSRDLVQVSILLADPLSTDSPEAIQAVAGLFGIVTDREQGQSFDPGVWASRLSGFHMVSVAGRDSDSHVLRALGYAVTGLLRQTIGFDSTVASALFNGGVELLQISSKSLELLQLRSILNGIGLLGALKSTRDLVEAMTVNDGLDCLVNLLGSLVDLARNPATDLRREGSRLVTVVATLGHLTALEPRNEARITRSLEALAERDIRPTGERLGPGEFEEVVRDLVNAIGRRLSLGTEIARGSAVVDMAPMVHAAFATLMPFFSDDLGRAVSGPEEARQIMADYLTDLVGKLMVGPDNPYDMLRLIYSQPLPGSEETLASIGPLRAIRLMGSAEWQATLRKALGLDRDDGIAEVIRDAFAGVQVEQARPLATVSPVPIPASAAAPTAPVGAARDSGDSALFDLFQSAQFQAWMQRDPASARAAILALLGNPAPPHS
ncbi:hypothetical protein GV832_20340 [Rhodobacteraceae bacterium CYK-10]|uniref:Uncharacterized protein n=1 Tax=Stagnihabitans tardus TaxID=2699202 RepID=A0AAE4YCB0_9RHOB|nr:hypothetical protein [Stagnihabitans tardus]